LLIFGDKDENGRCLASGDRNKIEERWQAATSCCSLDAECSRVLFDWPDREKGKGVAAARFWLRGWRNDHGKPMKQEIETALGDFSG
jgi:hypothetical protein